jgi:hypothetical protein
MTYTSQDHSLPSLRSYKRTFRTYTSRQASTLDSGGWGGPVNNFDCPTRPEFEKVAARTLWPELLGPIGQSTQSQGFGAALVGPWGIANLSEKCSEVGDPFYA